MQSNLIEKMFRTDSTSLLKTHDTNESFANLIFFKNENGKQAFAIMTKDIAIITHVFGFLLMLYVGCF
jgi:hypothetical protein